MYGGDGMDMEDQQQEFLDKGGEYQSGTPGAGI